MGHAELSEILRRAQLYWLSWSRLELYTSSRVYYKLLHYVFRQAPPLQHPNEDLSWPSLPRAPRSPYLFPSGHTAMSCSSLYTSTHLETTTPYSTVTYYSTSYTVLSASETSNSTTSEQTIVTSERVSLTRARTNAIAGISARVNLRGRRDSCSEEEQTVVQGRLEGRVGS